MKALVRWATGKRLTNRLPKLSLITNEYPPPLTVFEKKAHICREIEDLNHCRLRVILRIYYPLLLRLADALHGLRA